MLLNCGPYDNLLRWLLRQAEGDHLAAITALRQVLHYLKALGLCQCLFGVGSQKVWIRMGLGRRTSPQPLTQQIGYLLHF
jgi:hypothetical protein